MRTRSFTDPRPIVVAASALLANVLWAGQAPAQVACGDTVTASVTLVQDLDCTGDGLIVGADKITIDLNGFVLEGDGDPGDVGIDNGGGFDQVTIKDGTVAEFGECVSVGGDAQKTKITDVVAFGCGADGFDLNDSDLGTVKGCLADGNGERGYVLGDGATGNKIEKSAAVGNGGSGFEVAGTGNTLKKVDATVNNQGFTLLGADNTISGCTAYRNTNAGVFVNADGNHVSKCEASGNIDQGIRVLDAAGVTVDKNTATGNRQEGIQVAFSAGTVVKKNDAFGNELNGIRIEDDSPNAVVESNEATGNHTDGIESLNTTATLKKNEARLNGERGIQAPGVIDGGGNEASNNADTPQCEGVVCK